MTTVLEILDWLLAIGPALALSIYIVEVLFGLRRPRRLPTPDPGKRRDVALLIPAHNEAADIVGTLSRLKAVVPAGGRILVIADNCHDNTAELARSAGVEVAERTDAENRGKGYALSYGCSVLAADPPATVIVIDADATLSPGSVEYLCDATDGGLPAQALNLLAPDRSAPALVQISSFAFLIKNLVRLRGLGRTGRCSLLTGSGMAFPWAVFATAPLASGNITEDIALGLELTRRGARAQLVEQALVRSGAANVEASVAQRRRWEHGFLSIALRHALPLLMDGLRQRSRSMIALGLHLMVPPLALLLMVSLVVLVVLFGLAMLSGVWSAFLVLAGLIVVALGLTTIGWIRYGQETLRFGALLQAPLYVAWKVPLYLRFLIKREKNWQRTRRDGE